MGKDSQPTEGTERKKQRYRNASTGTFGSKCGNKVCWNAALIVLMYQVDYRHRSLYYNRLLSSMREALKAYQKNPNANIYIAIPELPHNVMTHDAKYSGGAVFSRNAAWTIFLNTRDSPILEVHFMNGDGHTIGGSGIGEVKFRYDLEKKFVTVTASGVGIAAFGTSQEQIPVGVFDAASSAIVKSFLEYQINHL